LTKLRTGVLVLGGAGTALVFTAIAVAGVATSVSAYGGEAGRAQASVAGAVNASSLPFTGTNLSLIVLAGLVLVAAGLVLRRRARSTS
jgi:LPXTG-motif cell wall-anchored protein